jgi:hypothetical protein
MYIASLRDSGFIQRYQHLVVNSSIGSANFSTSQGPFAALKVGHPATSFPHK